MNNTVNSTNEVTFEQVLGLARRLRTVDQVRLVARLTPQVEMALVQMEEAVSALPRKSLRGLLADLGPAPSAADIEEIQREMWATFAQE